jgi:hypothetical protein
MNKSYTVPQTQTELQRNPFTTMSCLPFKLLHFSVLPPKNGFDNLLNSFDLTFPAKFEMFPNHFVVTCQTNQTKIFFADITDVSLKGETDQFFTIELLTSRNQSHCLSLKLEFKNGLFSALKSNSKIGFSSTGYFSAKEFVQRGLTDLWKIHQMSTLRYLAAVNFYSGRSFHIKGFYPIFPNVLQDNPLPSSSYSFSFPKCSQFFSHQIQHQFPFFPPDFFFFQEIFSPNTAFYKSKFPTSYYFRCLLRAYPKLVQFIDHFFGPSSNRKLFISKHPNRDPLKKIFTSPKHLPPISHTTALGGYSFIKKQKLKVKIVLEDNQQINFSRKIFNRFQDQPSKIHPSIPFKIRPLICFYNKSGFCYCHETLRFSQIISNRIHSTIEAHPSITLFTLSGDSLFFVRNSSYVYRTQFPTDSFIGDLLFRSDLPISNVKASASLDLLIVEYLISRIDILAISYKSIIKTLNFESSIQHVLVTPIFRNIVVLLSDQIKLFTINGTLLREGSFVSDGYSLYSFFDNEDFEYVLYQKIDGSIYYFDVFRFDEDHTYLNTSKKHIINVMYSIGFFCLVLLFDDTSVAIFPFESTSST